MRWPAPLGTSGELVRGRGGSVTGGLYRELCGRRCRGGGLLACLPLNTRWVVWGASRGRPCLTLTAAACSPLPTTHRSGPLATLLPLLSATYPGRVFWLPWVQ